MKRFKNFALVGLTVLLLVPLAGQAETDPATGLVMDTGWEIVRANCGGCHSHALVTAQRADRDNWLKIIRWMQETQNLWQFDAKTETELLDYLAKNYAPEPNRRRAPVPEHLRPES